MSDTPEPPNDTTTDAVQAILAAPVTVEKLPDGRVRVTKAGVIGVGSTRVEATREMVNKLTAILYPRSE